MRQSIICAIAALSLAGCGRTSSSNATASADAASGAKSAANAATSTASATPSGVGGSGLQVSDADRAAILKTANLTANAQGQVKNECDDMITPQLLPVDLGPAVGASVLLVMSGGPTLASCYGDGPGLTLFRHVGGSWKQIYSSRGASLVVMKEQHNGAPDIVFGGPGF